MKWLGRFKTMGACSGVFCIACAFSTDSRGRPHEPHPYRHSVVDMPVSLAVGEVRTPEVPVVQDLYYIMIQVEKPLPFPQMMCMMAVTQNQLDRNLCTSDDPLLRADWKVLDGSQQIVRMGSSTLDDHATFTNKHIFKVLGKFVVHEAARRYVVEVHFTHDGTALDVANPHLIVIRKEYQ